MSTGRFVLAGLLALVLAVGASSTASARTGNTFGFMTSPFWGGYYYGGLAAPAQVMVQANATHNAVPARVRNLYNK